MAYAGGELALPPLARTQLPRLLPLAADFRLANFDEKRNGFHFERASVVFRLLVLYPVYNHHEVIHDLTLAYRNMKMESFVMPAWMAGIQVRRMRPETSMSAWIPALHAGMTQSRNHY